MAVSGSFDFTLNAREVITHALKNIMNVLALTQALDADEAAAAMETLNLMLKSWQRKGPHLWSKREGTITLTNATTSYDLATAPNALNPLRILAARYRDANSNDLPMRLFTREQYFDLPIKSSSGIPTQYYFDPQIGTPTFYVWPVKATITTETIRTTYQERIDDIDDLGNSLGIPQEWLETVAYSLAARLLDPYGIEGEVANRVIMRAEQLSIEAQDWEREDTIVIMPDAR